MHSLPQELTIYTVGELHPQWRGWIMSATDDAPWCVDAQPVEEVDAAGVQLLIALDKGLKARNCALQLVGASAPLQQACAGLGLDSWLTQRSQEA